jgi:tellurite resistance protein TehA-like permease
MASQTSTAHKQHGNRLLPVVAAVVLALVALGLELGLYYNRAALSPVVPLIGGVVILAGVFLLLAPILRHHRKSS